MDHQELLQVKENIGGLLLGVGGVISVGVGVGVAEGKLTVLLTENKESTKKRVTEIVHNGFPGTPIEFIVMEHLKGGIQRQGSGSLQ